MCVCVCVCVCVLMLRHACVSLRISYFHSSYSHIVADAMDDNDDDAGDIMITMITMTITFD